MHVDRLELVSEKQRHQRAGLDFGIAHHRRGHRDPEPGHDAGKHPGAGIGVNAAAHVDRCFGAVTAE